MTLILRPDLRCPHRCHAAIVEMRNKNSSVSEFRCKAHGVLRPPENPLPRIHQKKDKP